MTAADRWKHAVLTVGQMERADHLAAQALAGGSFALMRAAGSAVAEALRQAFPRACGFDVLCGPGNNGGDGYAAARCLAEQGLPVAVWRLSPPKSADAVRAAAECSCRIHALEAFEPDAGRVAVDALFGAGLSRPLEERALTARDGIEAAGMTVAAVDLPSGIAGDSGTLLGQSFKAALTVTFVRKKPAHLLYPGRARCGRIVVADIGVPEGIVAAIGPKLFENGPGLWRETLPWPEDKTHKYKRGHLGVCSGGPHATGAARLAAQAGARIGAGAVTVLSPAGALAANAAHLTAIMLREVEAADDLEALIDKARLHALVLGPGFGDLDKARRFALAALCHRRAGNDGAETVPLVLDADGITAFREEPDALFQAAGGGAPRLVLTPHEGEFQRLFPDLAADPRLSRIAQATEAAARSGAVIVLKGPDTVIAEPSGRAAVNGNATPFLATAGSGDVLSGLCGGLLAQGMPVFEAACAAVWIHAEAGRRFGPGLTADDLPDALLPVVRDLAPAGLR